MFHQLLMALWKIFHIHFHWNLILFFFISTESRTDDILCKPSTTFFTFTILYICITWLLLEMTFFCVYSTIPEIYQSICICIFPFPRAQSTSSTTTRENTQYLTPSGTNDQCLNQTFLSRNSKYRRRSMKKVNCPSSGNYLSSHRQAWKICSFWCMQSRLCICVVPTFDYVIPEEEHGEEEGEEKEVKDGHGLILVWEVKCEVGWDWGRWGWSAGDPRAEHLNIGIWTSKLCLVFRVHFPKIK